MAGTRRLEPGSVLGHYTIRRQVGAGGMGVVYRATDNRLRRDVALKILPEFSADDAKRLARFEHEAHVLASLNHPNIAAIYGFEATDHGNVLVMEFIEGDTLVGLLRAGPLSIDKLVLVAQQVSEALAAAHERGIIHRDLKPANVKITPEGRVKILDFGLAKEVQPVFEDVSWEESTGEVPLELSGVSGTLPYMAPEQLRGEAVDARTDIFALGVLIYEMATGQRPYARSRGARLIGEIQHTPPKALRTVNDAVPVWLERIALRCLAKEPAARFRTMHEVTQALQAGAKAAEQSPLKSLAVLYFESPSNSDEDVYFRDGMTEDIMVELAKVGDLNVLSRSTMQAFRDSHMPAREVGSRLGAAYALDGSLRRIGNRLRLSVQLIETATDRTVWASRYDRELKDVFEIQDEIAHSIASALRVVLSDAEKRAIEKVPTTNVEAYQYYLRGRMLFRQFRRKSIEFARRTITQAIEIDPEYAAAWAALADCHSYLYMFWDASEAHKVAADEASRRALEIDPELAEAYVARGVAASVREQYEQAVGDFESAIRLNPTLFEAYYFRARGHYALGEREQAVHWFECAMNVRPEDYQAPSLLGSALRGLGRMEEARAAFQKALERGLALLEVEPGNTRAMYFSALAMCQLGDEPSKVIALAERALSVDPDEPQVLYNVGCIYALLGYADKAIECLAATIAHGGWWKKWMRNDPDLDHLQGDSRFQELVRET